ncbi:hypothetical protein J6590_050878 [Homalodisca vitripennis]|nr:hypothetical protein J6590_050878 [Homalodisca vitripennis]
MLGRGTVAFVVQPAQRLMETEENQHLYAGNAERMFHAKQQTGGWLLHMTLCALPANIAADVSAKQQTYCASTAGTHFSWSSPTLPKLEAADSWLPINSDQASWIGSLTALGTVFGPFLGGWLVNTIGRRWTIVTSVMICLVAWIILLFANSVWIIYIGRFIGGAGGGIAFLACPMYVAEISEVCVWE